MNTSPDNQNIYKRVYSTHGYSLEIPNVFEQINSVNMNTDLSFTMKGLFLVRSFVTINYDYTQEHLYDLASRSKDEIKNYMETDDMLNLDVLKSVTTFINDRLSYFQFVTYQSKSVRFYLEEINQVRKNKLLTVILICPYELHVKFTPFFDLIRNSLD